MATSAQYEAFFKEHGFYPGQVPQPPGNVLSDGGVNFSDPNQVNYNALDSYGSGAADPATVIDKRTTITPDTTMRELVKLDPEMADKLGARPGSPDVVMNQPVKNYLNSDYQKKQIEGHEILSQSLIDYINLPSQEKESSGFFPKKLPSIIDDNKGAIVGGVTGFIVSGGNPLGAAVGASAGAGIDATDKSAKVQKEATDKAIKTQKETADKQTAAITEASETAAETAETALTETKDIIDTTKGEIIEISDELQKFVDDKNIDVADALKNSTNESADILITALNAAKDADDAGDIAVRDELLGGITRSADALKRGETDYAAQQLEGIANASTRFTDTQTQAKQNLAPWMENGEWATTQLKDRYEELTRKFTLDDFAIDPGYEFRLKKGQDAIINRGSAIGVTGNTAAELVEYSQDYASSEIDKAYVKFRDFQNNATNYLSNISNQGLDATTQYNDILANTNQNLANLDLESGNVLANRDLNIAGIDAAGIEAGSNVNADYLATQAGRTSGNVLATGDINAGRRTSLGGIDAAKDQSDIESRTFIDTNKIGAITGAAGGNVNALQNYSSTIGNLAVNEGNALSNIYGNQGTNTANLQIAQGQNSANRAIGRANVFGNALSNYLFLRSGPGFGGGGSGGGGTNVPNNQVFSNVG